MRVGLAFVAGMIGWAVMVAIVSILRAAGATELDLSMIVGSLFTRQATAGTWGWGFVIGLIISGFIAWIYAAIFEGLRRSNWGLGLVGGIIHAGIGGLVFAWLSTLLPTTPGAITPPGFYAANYGGWAVVIFFIGHMVYGAIVGGMYRPIHTPSRPAMPQATPEEHAVGSGSETYKR